VYKRQALGDLAQAIEAGALTRTEELSGEVRMLEDLIQQMSASIDQRLTVTPMVAPDSAEARRFQQSNILLRTVLDALTEMVPRLRYRHPHNPAHVPNHILSALVGTSLTLPVADGRLVLGTWQRVVLIEFEGPRRREVAVTLVPSEL